MIFRYFCMLNEKTLPVKTLVLLLSLMICPIIPQVSSYTETGDGSLILAPGSSYSLAVSGDKSGADAFRAYLAASQLALTESTQPAIRFKIGPKALKGKKADDGAYALSVGKKGIVVRAAGFTGAFYAVQSLLQLRANPEHRVPYCQIEDAPRFAYRGLMFDVVRHFHSKEFLFKQLDLMALLKMNVLHLHLTDNEAWRIALDSAPEMTREAAFGDRTYFHTFLPAFSQTFCARPAGYVSGTLYDQGAIYGGYYSKADIREIIDYAAARHIDIIPEIELPGHNKALMHVHPEFFCDGSHPVKDVFCPGNEAVFDFFFPVLEEVMALFPSPYMHIGGDEANKGNWPLCSRCQERMRQEGLKDVYELQSYCIRRVDQFISAHGKKMIGWDEILEGGLSENATVMSWRGVEGGVESIRMGHDVVMSPNTYYYLDYGQDAPWNAPAAFNYYLPLETVYTYEPEDDIVAACEGQPASEVLTHLLGVQGNLWSEFVITDSHFEYMLYPRAFAIAETGWSAKQGKDYADFRNRSQALSSTLEAKGYTLFPLASEAGQRKESAYEIPRVTQQARAVIHLGTDDLAGKEVPMLVDGHLGGWGVKGNSDWVDTNKRTTSIDIDLGDVKDLHYVGAEFMDYKLRSFYAPEDTEFFLSVDGVEYVRADIPQLRLSPERKDYAILTVGGTVSAQARYVRLRYNTGAVKYRAFISEVIVN